MYCTLLLNCAYYYEVQYFLFLYTFGTGFVFGQSLQDLCWPFTFRLLLDNVLFLCWLCISDSEHIV